MLFKIVITIDRIVEMVINQMKNKLGDYIEVTDANGNDMFIGSVINHSGNLYVIKFSTNKKEIVARKEPLKGQTSSWRNIDWIKRCSPYIKIIGTILFDDEDLNHRFKDVM